MKSERIDPRDDRREKQLEEMESFVVEQCSCLIELYL